MRPIVLRRTPSSAYSPISFFAVAREEGVGVADEYGGEQSQYERRAHEYGAQVLRRGHPRFDVLVVLKADEREVDDDADQHRQEINPVVPGVAFHVFLG
ncbi:hypothetical protein [Cohnella rhizosphaerae]|uniref:Uncharacterized protein n=1 Tax=Cohnella rhizosphaerae TaxID=1457232 RepID=A0A9X4KZ87_9BACL|nr:hypothetical protein [Cohnella rhizosphaerae]MDG0814101.1 hypothetical protein [Cohnella rhizosphaerae]